MICLPCYREKVRNPSAPMCAPCSRTARLTSVDRIAIAARALATRAARERGEEVDEELKSLDTLHAGHTTPSVQPLDHKARVGRAKWRGGLGR
jgi:hypothetical protein